MTTLTKTGLDEPIRTRAALIDYLRRGARPRAHWGIGVEAEKLVVHQDSGEAASYAQIEALLANLEARGGWRGIREEGRLIALQGQTSSMTLEPGGQLELSGQFCPDIHCSHGDFQLHQHLITSAAEELGLMFLGLGTQPFSTLADIEWVPKQRYRIMGPYMLRTGDMGQRMMKQTAGLQVNLDFSDEADALTKLRLGLLLAPLYYALFANSPFLDGQPSGFLSTRGEIWARTDKDRCGLLPQLFDPDAGFGTYVDYALDVPMYFIQRQGRYLDMTATPYPFRRFLAEGFAGEQATLGDWDTHLSTLFPEVRLRPQIELRAADSLPPDRTMAVAALAKGLMYDPQALEDAGELLRRELLPELPRVYTQSWQCGLKTPVGKHHLQDICRDILCLAREGLRRQRHLAASGLDETCYLDAIAEVAESGQTLAESLLANWPAERSAQLALLQRHCGFARGR